MSIGLSKHLRGTTAAVLIDDRNIRVLDRTTGTLIRKLFLDPTRGYQPTGAPDRVCDPPPPRSEDPGV